MGSDSPPNLTFLILRLVQKLLTAKDSVLPQNFALEKRICHMIHICDLCGLHELCEYVSSELLLEKMISHEIHICNPIMAFMNCINMFLQRSCLSKWSTTRYTFVIFVTFMKCMNVFLQISCIIKWFTTWFTFFISVALMNCMDMFLQRFCFRKWFSTWFAFVISLAFMNWVDVFL